MPEEESGNSNEINPPLCHYILYGAVVFFLAVVAVIFLFWAITRPTKPGFTLEDATVYSLNLSSAISQPNVLSANMQVTISSGNKMDKIGVYYEKLDVQASYRTQQITLPTLLPVTYLGHRESAVWSPFLNANPVPVSPYLAQALAQDLNVGSVLLNIRVEGRVKWKLGAFISGKYRLIANCPAYITTGEKGEGIVTMKLQSAQRCYVDV